MTDAEKVMIQEGIRISGDKFVERQYVKDPQKWNSFLYVYSECYSKNDRMLFEIPDDSDLCKPILVQEGDFYFLFYKDWDGEVDPIAFTHKSHAESTSSLDTIPAWWN